MVHASSGKGSTALELVKSRLQNSSHFSAAHIANLQLVAKEISEAVRGLEKQKQAREAEAREREEKILEEQRKQAEKEEKERELLVRKQKLIKEKQDKRGSTIVSTAANSSSSGTTSPTIPYSSIPGPNSSTPEDPKAAALAAAAAAADTASGRKRKKKGKKEEEEIAPNSGRVGLSEAAVVDVASRDELVHHLLAMGFSEPDCLAAIALYGKDMDRALSWLCERPPSNSVSTSNTDTAALLASTNPSSHSHSASSTHKSLAHSMHTVKRDPDVVAAAVAQSQQSSLHNAISMSAEQLARVQKEKEELRRINRAWNQKAEDEKRKAEAERKLKEAERHHEMLFQQQLLIQQKHQQQLQEQQQLLQQQQMHQMLAQHQRKLLASRSLGSGNYNALNDNRLHNNLHNNQSSYQSRQHQQQPLMGSDHRDFGGMGRLDPNSNNRDSSHSFGLGGSSLLRPSQSSAMSASPMNGPLSSGSALTTSFSISSS